TNSPFQIEVGLPATGDPAKVEETLDREIARIQTDGITESELSRAKTQLRTSWAAHLQTTGAKASYLATYTTYYNDPDRINTLFSRQNAVTLDDVKRVANTYLAKENSVTIVVNPGLADAPANNNGNTGHSPEEAQ
ncbi:MAG TPA: insulinase family protein, partial [Armatimonadota bacterium]|nr:insulinase family protein [Armatimonadota bacterium]